MRRTFTALALLALLPTITLAASWHNLYHIDCDDIGFSVDRETAPLWYTAIPDPEPVVVLYDKQFQPVNTVRVHLTRFDLEPGQDNYITLEPWFPATGLPNGPLWVHSVVITDTENTPRQILFPPIARPDPPDVTCGVWRAFLPLVLRSGPPTER